MSSPFNIQPKNDDEKFMLEALKQAWRAYQDDEVPVGAVLVHQGHVIARGFNQVETLTDATAHAEVLCLTAGENAIGDWRLLETTLYCTIEPCIMCAGAMFLTRIKRLVWGAPDIRHGANGSWMDVFDKKHPMHEIEVTSGILAEASASLMRDFFKQKRVKNEG